MRVLLVEDEAPKRRHIHDLLHAIAPNVEIDTAKSVDSALETLEKSPPDVVLLDMSLPTFDVDEQEPGGRPQGFGGIEILREIELSEMFVPAIVITGYEAFKMGDIQVSLDVLRKQLFADFPRTFRGLMHFNSTYEEWKEQLSTMLRDLGCIGKDR